MIFLSNIRHGGPEYQKKQEEKREEKKQEREVYRKAYNPARNKALREKARLDARRNVLGEGKKTGGGVLGALAKMGEGVQFNPTNDVLFGSGSSAPRRKGKRREPENQFSIDHLFK